MKNVKQVIVKNLSKGSLYLFVVLLLSVMLACSSDDDGNGDVGSDGFDGSIESVEEFYTPELVSSLEDLGFNINEGGSPPNIEGTYLSSPLVLEASTVPGDPEGSTFNDFTSTFSNLNVDELTVDFLGDQNSSSSVGDGSLVSGSNGQFTVYLKTDTQNQGSVVVSSALVISGTLTNEGIENFQLAALMLDDKGDPDDVYIDNNTGRLFEDGDGLSPSN